MALVEQFIERAKQAPAKVVLPEGNDERIVQAACLLAREGIAKPIVLGSAEEVAGLAGGDESLRCGLRGWLPQTELSEGRGRGAPASPGSPECVHAISYLPSSS